MGHSKNTLWTFHNVDVWINFKTLYSHFQTVQTLVMGSDRTQTREFW